MMTSTKKLALAVVIALTANVALAQSAAQRSTQGLPSASALLRFYPTRLASTPMGAVEDQEVWLAKVQGLMAGAPPLLQQSLLASQTPREFTANVALLQQMQERSAQQSALRMQSRIQSEGLITKTPVARPAVGGTQQQ